jgi:cytochrome c oxidase subunit III
VSTSAPSLSAEKDLNSTSLLTVVIVLATVTMTFGALIAVFFIRSQAQMLWGHIALPGTLWFTTVVLLVSSWTLERARTHLVANQQRQAHNWLGISSLLGLVFLLGQFWAWRQVLQSGVVLAHNPHSWFIFLFSGLHALHILLGLAGIGYLYLRTREVVTGPRYLMKTRVVSKGVAIFWHYLDVLWIFLFGLLLLWRR